MLRKARWQGTYPVEGDSAVAELLFGEERIGDVRMVRDELHVAFYPPTGGVRESSWTTLSRRSMQHELG